MPSVRSICPLRPKLVQGVPVAASTAMSRASMVPTKMRRRHSPSARAAGSSHVDTPRDVTIARRRVRSILGSYRHRSRPVSASRAITRLHGVLRNSVPSIMSGVASKAMNPPRTDTTDLAGPIGPGNAQTPDVPAIDLGEG